MFPCNLKRAVRISLFVVLSVLAAGSLTAGVLAIIPTFEIDGNVATDNVNPGTPDDWDRIYAGTDNSVLTVGILQDPPGLTRFTGGSKDTDDISAWAWDDNSSPHKDEIVDAYAALYSGGVFAFGADRYATNGDAQIGFWLLQGNVGLIPGGSFSGTHQIGDILVLSDFTGGGGIATTRLYQWVGSGGSEGTLDELTVDPSIATAVVNTDPVSSPWPYTPKSGTAGVFPTGAFFEGAVDLSALGITGCFNSFIAETRTSQSVTSALKDFVFGSFDAIPEVTVPDTLFCFGESGELCAEATGGVPPYTYLWDTGETTRCITVTETGTHCVIVTGANGCSAESVCGSATELPPLECLITGPETACPADTNSYCGPEGMKSYQWFIVGNGTIVPPSNAQCVEVIAGVECGGEPFTLTLAIVDSSDCSNECDFIATVDDDIVPTLTCPDSLLVQCPDDVPPPDPSLVVADDNCDVEVRWDGDVSDNLTCPETIARRYVAVDNCGNQAACTQYIVVDDTEAPVILTCPGILELECDEVIPEPDPGLVSAEDNCDLDVDVRHIGDVSDGQSCPETITRTYRATDDCGNYTDCVQYIVIDDTTTPRILQCPDSAFVQCTNDVPAPDTSLVLAEDNCDDDLTITHEGDESDGQTCPETITRTYRVTDDCDNHTDCIQYIVVNDTIEPSITCPDSAFVQCAGDVPDSDIGLVSAEDNCDDDPAITHEGDVSDGQTCPETIARTYRATDECGNFADCIQYIVVDDTIPPVIACPDSLWFECDDVGEFGEPTVEDNCDPGPDVTFEDVVTAGNCPFESTIVRTWSATDECGNTSSCVQLITIEDTTAPTLTCAEDDTVACSEPVVFTDPETIDNCDPEPEVREVRTDTLPGPFVGGFTLRRCWIAVDACDNESEECCQTVYVLPCACTYTQGGWGSGCPGPQVERMDSTQPGCIRDHFFTRVFPNGVMIGDPDGPGDGDTFYAAHWTTAAAVEAYLPAGKKPSVLTMNATNPTMTSAGVLGGQLLALTMNVYYAEAGVFAELGLLPEGVSVGDVVIPPACGDKFEGLTVYEFLVVANQAVSGNTDVLEAYDNAKMSHVNETATCMNEMFDECNLNIPEMPQDYFSDVAPEPVGGDPGPPTLQLREFTVMQAYPNPFTHTCNIRFGLPNEGRVSVEIFDVAGRRVASVIDEQRPAGFHTAVWDGRNSSGHRVAAGIYFYRVKYANETAINKMIMLQ